METTIRVQASFRLKADLMERLRMGAKASNRSLNNFVENVLLEAMFREPNETTKASIAEAMNNKDKKAYDNVDELMNELMK
ncbi:MAG: toxin-antitoxin system protein [Bacteroides sp.]|nr:toxin-antitoxin system protein [Bacteroides sp.]